MHTDEKTDWHEDKQLDTKAKKNLKKPTRSFVNDAPPDTEYLHYPLNVECVSQQDSLLPAYIRYNNNDDNNNNNNNNNNSNNKNSTPFYSTILAFTRQGKKSTETLKKS